MRRTLTLALFCASTLTLFSGLDCPFNDGFSYSEDDDGFIPILAAPSLNEPCLYPCGSPYGYGYSSTYLGPWTFGDWGMGYDDYYGGMPGIFKAINK